MSRKFYAVNRDTGIEWKPSVTYQYDKEYLVMSANGCIIEVYEPMSGEICLTPLCLKTWKIVYQEKKD